MTEYEALLTGWSDTKIHAIKALRTTLKIGLKEAKEFCDEAEADGWSAVIFKTTNHQEASRIYNDLAAESVLHVALREEELEMTTAEWNLALFIAKELPIEPDDIRKIADLLSKTTLPI